MRAPPSMQWRMTLLVSSVFLALIVAFGWVSLANVHQGYEKAGAYQATLTHRIGTDLDDRLQTSLDALDKLGRTLPPNGAGHGARLQHWLDERAMVMAALFDKGLFVFDGDGMLLASSAHGAPLSGCGDLRRWVALTQKLDEPLIGLPCRGGDPARAEGSLLLPMAVPLYAAGKPAGAMVGVADIQRESLLGSIQLTKLGKSGYFFVTSWDGRALVHPDQGLLLSTDHRVVPTSLLEEANHGFRGPVETVDRSGTPVLATFVKMQATGWVLGAAYPTDEAYAQVHEQQRDVVLFIVVGTIVAALATWFLMHLFVAPLKLLADRVGAVDVTRGMLLDPVPVPRQSSEIARMGRSFNELIVRLNDERQQTFIAESVFRNVREGIIVTDPDSRIISCNQAFEDITGYGVDEVRGASPSLLKSGKHDADFYRQMWHGLTTSGSWRGEVWNKRKNGDIYPQMLNISAARDDDGELAFYVGIFSDISELKHQQHRLEVMATTDPLTGLPNRALLTDRLKQDVAHASRLGHMLAIAFVDLDDFKRVNDSEGHHIGDRLLIEAAGRFKEAARLGDTAARLGGDEFVLLLTNVGNRENALFAIQRILESIAAPYLVEGRTLTISASIGVTFFPSDDVDPDTLLRHADHAMYQAKNLGRARIHVFDPEYDKLFQSHQQLVEEIRNGLAKGEFVLHYQPKVDLLTRQVVGVEALLRWNHPERGFLYPGDFIDAVSTDNVVISIGNWVLAEACRQMETWRTDGGLRIATSVNIAARQIVQDDFVASLQETLRAHPDLDPTLLEIEILESDTLEDPLRMERVICECQAMGVKFSLDDFGTGYSSLSHLKNIPVNVLKIDRSFVMNMLSTPDDLAIVEGIVRLAAVFKRDVIAEGVETPQHIELLCKLGCYRGQGYGIAHPMPASELAPWIESYSRR